MRAIDPCINVEKQLISYHQNELTKERADQILKHLKTCKFCRKKSQDIKAISQAMKNLF